MKKKIVILLFSLVLVLGIHVQVSAAQKMICVSSIKGNTISYYSVQIKQEWGEIYGNKKKAKLAKKVKYYCFENNDEESPDGAPKTSKKMFIRRLKECKRYNQEGFYVYAVFKNKKCVKLIEPYWP